jgi:hypothetical protein
VSEGQVIFVLGFCAGYGFAAALVLLYWLNG